MRRIVLLVVLVSVVGVSLAFPFSVWAQQTAADTAHSGDYRLYLNLWNKRIYLQSASGEVLASYPIALGTIDTPSPIGMYQVIQKSKDWGGGFGSRWLGLNVEWGTYGIHGTNKPESVGRHASHGCFRMRNKDIEKLYPYVKVGMPVLIDGPIMGHERITYRILVPGTTGALVMLVQNRLRAAGYYKGRCHGRFDRQTERAVFEFQKGEGLPVTGQIGFADLTYLGIIE
jgi:hypothetical protein